MSVSPSTANPAAEAQQRDDVSNVCPGCGQALGNAPLLSSHDRMFEGTATFSLMRCLNCGLVSTIPRLRPSQFAEFYPDTYTAYQPTVASDATGVRQARGLVDRLRLAAITTLGPYRPLGQRRPGRMLDVGCGTGDLALAFGRRGWRVAGIDPSESACRRAAAAGLEIHCGTLDDAPWHTATFDAIVFNHSLEHVPDPATTLRHAASLLREGGMLAVGVPNFGSWQRRLFGGRWYQLDLPRHLQHFEAKTLTALIQDADLRVVEIRTFSMRPSILLSLQYALWGHARITERALRLAAWAVAPLLLLSDLILGGDCLHVFAVRDTARV
jgi:2-polyprenyl-3-methyl-5-hydroxy-6-metoxy-1,4-benzoquinol methylase